LRPSRQTGNAADTQGKQELRRHWPSHNQRALSDRSARATLLGRVVDREEGARAGGDTELTKDDMDIVSALLEALADRVGKQRFELWFGPRTKIGWDGQVLTICAPSQFFVDWIRLNFRGELEEVGLAVLNRRPELDFRVEVPGPASAGDEVSGGGVAGSPIGAQRPVHSGEDAMVSLNGQGARDVPRAAETGAASRIGGAARQAAPAPAFSPRKFASLSSFVVGANNRMAMYSAEMVACNPGQITPLFVHGPTSVGKTHLLEGIWSAQRKAGRGTNSVYLSAEQFTSQFLEALRGNGLPVFRRKYRGVNVLLLDDLQFLAGKRATQIEMTHTVENLLRDGRQLVFAADRAPSELGDFMPELVTRLTGGMVCRIEPPDFFTRLGIVGHLSCRMGVELPPDVQQFIATRLTGHARELSGAICRLLATSEATKRKISVALAEEALSEMIQHSMCVVRLADIEKAVCKVFGLEPQTLQSDGKTRRVSHPRMLAMWLARKHTRAALSEIGAFFGHRSHSTVISAQKRVDSWVAVNEPLCLAEQTCKIDDAIRQVERQLAM
jgi:chromosomal replication initiator protein